MFRDNTNSQTLNPSNYPAIQFRRWETIKRSQSRDRLRLRRRLLLLFSGEAPPPSPDIARPRPGSLVASSAGGGGDGRAERRGQRCRRRSAQVHFHQWREDVLGVRAEVPRDMAAAQEAQSPPQQQKYAPLFLFLFLFPPLSPLPPSRVCASSHNLSLLDVAVVVYTFFFFCCCC